MKKKTQLYLICQRYKLESKLQLAKSINLKIKAVSNMSKI